MRAAPVVILLAAAATLVAGLLLIPRADERFAMALRDKRLSEALEILQEQRPETMSAASLMERFSLAERTGDIQDAELVMKVYLQRNPSDARALEALAALYRATQQGGPYLETRLESYRRYPSREVFRDVVGQYRLAGDVGAELDFAAAGIAAGWADNGDIARTGLLYAAAGQQEQGAELLSKLPPHSFEDFRQAHLTRVALLLKLGRSEEALRAARAMAAASADAIHPLKTLFGSADPRTARAFTEIENNPKR